MRVSTMIRISPGVNPESRLMDRITDLARQVEARGFPGIWIGDSLGRGRPTLDSLQVLTALAAVTDLKAALSQPGEAGGVTRRVAHLEEFDPPTQDQIRSAIEECAAYFRVGHNPYRRWFDPLDEILRAALGVSFYDDTACHLDLVQWATRPAWGELSTHGREILLWEGLPHLRRLLRHGNVRTVLLNGRQVIDHVMAARLGELRPSGEVRINPMRACSLYTGEFGAVKFIGWSTNLQSSWGIGLHFRARLAAAVIASFHLMRHTKPQGEGGIAA
jgi:Luciferase-like monooxygenase